MTQAGNPVQDPALVEAGHTVHVRPIAGLAPFCSCGWPVTEGGTRMVWRPGDKLLFQHIAEVRASLGLPLNAAEAHYLRKGNDMTEIKVGTHIEQRFGPYKAVAEVIEVTEHGAVLAYPFNAVLVGYDSPISAPNGTPLTTDPAHGFLGKAHFRSAKVVTP